MDACLDLSLATSYSPRLIGYTALVIPHPEELVISLHHPTSLALLATGALTTGLLVGATGASAAGASPATSPPVQTTASAKAAASNAAPAKRFERWATLTRTSYGYYYDAGQQDTHLTVTVTANGRLRYADTHTDVLRQKAKACHRRPARVGLVVVCRVPEGVGPRHPMTLRVFTRLGNDTVDTTALPERFELYMLCDRGRDEVRAGAGDDFVNGAQNADRIWGGPGNDWLRSNKGNDAIWGGPGNDRVVGVDGRDRLHGGTGNDRVGGGSGNDRLYANKGHDRVLCGGGRDRAIADRADRTARDCESVRFK